MQYIYGITSSELIKMVKINNDEQSRLIFIWAGRDLQCAVSCFIPLFYLAPTYGVFWPCRVLA